MRIFTDSFVVFFQSETSSVTARCDVTCVTDDDVIENRMNQSEEENDEDEDQWMYKWYDFHENGIVSKQVRLKAFIQSTTKDFKSL